MIVIKTKRGKFRALSVFINSVVHLFYLQIVLAVYLTKQLSWTNDLTCTTHSTTNIINVCQRIYILSFCSILIKELNVNSLYF